MEGPAPGARGGARAAPHPSAVLHSAPPGVRRARATHMSFLAPLWLALGAAVAVPLLLHLLRRNVATRVEFPAARYLQRAEAEHSRSLRIRNLLLMMLRVLIVLAIAFAAARPFLPGLGVGHAPTAMAIVLDNSVSTTAVIGGRAVFDRLRDATRALIAA